MPEIPYKIRSHPAKLQWQPGPREPEGQRLPVQYAELAVTSNFTFLQGASHPDELVAQAAALGHAAVAITDTNTLAGIVRAHAAAREIGIPLVVGCRLKFTEPAGLEVLVYPTDLASYGRLCGLLSLGKRLAAKGQCHLALHDLLEASEGLLAAVVPPAAIDQDFIDVLAGLRGVFDDDRLSLAASCPYGPDDRGRLEQLAILSAHARVPLLATNNVHYHAPSRRALQDVLTCIRHCCTIAQAGMALLPNAERHLKEPSEMARLFAAYPQAIRRTAEIAARAASFSLEQIRYQYPHEVCPPGKTPMEYLRELAHEGAAQRYPAGLPQKVHRQLEHELALIEELKYAPYFLTVHDLVRFARSQDILCQGRGAAANSAVCFCLGVTSVDPDRIDVLFERFISRERNEPPDIDIDFEHERREEVIQYIYRKYGRHRAALTAEVISYRGRLAVREVGKVLGLPEDRVDRLAKAQDWWDDQPLGAEVLAHAGLSIADPTVAALVLLTNELMGFPRHLSQHVGGFVITQAPLCELVPIENAAMPDRTIIEWDKDDIDAMGMIKVDCLGLGMLTCIRKCLDLVNSKYPPQRTQSVKEEGTRHQALGTRETAGTRHQALGTSQKQHSKAQEVSSNTGDSPSAYCLVPSALPLVPSALSIVPSALSPGALSLATIPPEDPAVYDMICRADTVGVFQIESRAQMSMLPRLRPRCFYDLVIEVAIVRPGPIVGDMVHPYLRRRQGIEPVVYPDDKVRDVLGKTLGVPLFQEQAMKLSMVAGGFSPDQADQLRRAIASKRGKVKLDELGRKLVQGMIARGYSHQFAQKCFQQFQGFSQYGFPESHAASFALLVYASCWLKRRHPAAFAAALLNSQPMGFYAPAQIVADVQRHGVAVRGVDVNFSGWDCRLEDFQLPIANCQLNGTRHPNPDSRNLAIRLGMRMVKGMRQADATLIEQAVAGHGRFEDIESLWRSSGASVGSLRCLAAADAFGSMGIDRQGAIWQIQALDDEPMPLLEQRGDWPEGTGSEPSFGEVPVPVVMNDDPTSTTAGTGTSIAKQPAISEPVPWPVPVVTNDDPASTTAGTGSRLRSNGELRRAKPRPNDGSEPDSFLLPPLTEFQKVMQDYESTGLTLRRHPMSFLRPALEQRNVVTTRCIRDAKAKPAGSWAKVAGIVLVRQRPSSAAGVVFVTIEDETGAANLMIRPAQYPKLKRALGGAVILCSGRVERAGQVVHVIANDLQDISPELRELDTKARNFH